MGGWVVASRDSSGLRHEPHGVIFSVVLVKARVLPCTRPEHLEQNQLARGDDDRDAFSDTKKRRQRFEKEAQQTGPMSQAVKVQDLILALQTMLITIRAVPEIQCSIALSISSS